jgi:hypothetical protein
LAAIVRGGNPQPVSNRAAWNPSYILECTTYTHLELERLVINFAQTRLGTLRYILPSPTAALRQAPVAERLVALPPENQGSAQWPIFFLFFQLQHSITMQPERWAKRLIARAIPFMTLANPI